MKFVRSLIHLSLSLLPFHAPSAWADTDFKPEYYKSNHKTGIDYRIHIPDNIDNNKLYPLVIFLHGAGQRGSDNISQLALGQINASWLVVWREHGQGQVQHDYHRVLPLLNGLGQLFPDWTGHSNYAQSPGS